MSILSSIIDRLNQRIAVGNIFDQIYGLSELIDHESGKRWVHYIGNGQAEAVTGYDAKQGTLFWGKRGKVSVNKADAYKHIGCQQAYETRWPLTAYAVVKKSHLPCDSSDAVDWIAARVYKLASGTDPQFKTAIKVLNYESIPAGYADGIKSLPFNFEYACVAIDIDAVIITTSADSCYDACETGDIPLPDFEPCQPCLTQVYTDGETIVGNGTQDDPLVAIGGGGGGSIRIQDDGVTITNAATNLDFRGTGVAATLNAPGDVHIQIDRINLTAGTGVSVTGTYPNLTVANTAPATGSEVTGVTASAPISSSGGTTPNISIAQASSSTDGYLSSSDWIAFDGKQDTLTAGTGISLAGDVVTNTAPDQTVVLNAGSGIGVSGTYPNFTISNTQDLSGFVPYTGATQDVNLGANTLAAESLNVTGTNGAGHVNLRHQASNATATGQTTALFADSNGDLKTKNDNLHYSTFKTSGNTADRTYTFPNATGTVALTSDIPTYTGGTGISVAGTTITNTAPDQTVVLNAGVGVAVTGTYPNFTIAATGVQAIKSTTNGTATSGTSNTVSATRLIAGGTISVGNVVRITTRGIFTGAGGSKTMRVYLNSTPDLSGSPILLQTVTTATSALFAQRKGDLLVKSATETEFMSATLASLFTDESQTSVARSTANIDWTQNWYIVFANQCAAGTDSANTSGYTIEIL